MILLDTNTIVYYMQGLDAVVRRMETASRHELRIPSLVAYELEYGALNTGSAKRRTVSFR
jgi:predicted nucleic acid-binding protein